MKQTPEVKVYRNERKESGFLTMRLSQQANVRAFRLPVKRIVRIAMTEARVGCTFCHLQPKTLVINRKSCSRYFQGQFDGCAVSELWADLCVILLDFPSWSHSCFQSTKCLVHTYTVFKTRKKEACFPCLRLSFCQEKNNFPSSS